MSIKWHTGEKAGTVEFAGAVVRRSEYYAGHGSYPQLAIVWNEEQQEVQSINYGDDHSEYGSVTFAEITIDATPESIAKHDAWQKAKEDAAFDARKEQEAKTVGKGKVLIVVRGRKVAKGTKGVCVWMGNSGWGMNVMLIDASGNKHTTAIGNVEVVVGEKMTLPERPKTTVTVLGKVSRTSPKAILLKTEKGEFWFPNSQIKMVEGGYEMPDWLAKKAGCA